MYDYRKWGRAKAAPTFFLSFLLLTYYLHTWLYTRQFTASLSTQACLRYQIVRHSLAYNLSMHGTLFLTMTLISHFITYMIATPAIPLTIALGILLIYTFYLDHKIVMLTRGKSGASLEEIIHACIASVAKIEERNEVISMHALTLEEKVSHALRNAQTLRYKAFDTNGSNQSFSIALVNEKGNGVVISSLHSHERMSTFAKPIEHYESTYELTEEEQHVLKEAKQSHKVDIRL